MSNENKKNVSSTTKYATSVYQNNTKDKEGEF